VNHALTATLGALVDLHADEAPRNTGPDFGKASPFGLLVIVLLLIGAFLLVWSMNRQLKKVPDSFDRGHPAPDQAADEGTVDTLDPHSDEPDSDTDRDGPPPAPTG
jgi:hypothetical protein